jgi:hypothetical protein
LSWRPGGTLRSIDAGKAKTLDEPIETKILFAIIIF